MISITLIAVLLIILGLLILRKGIRGRKVHERPLCATCGYELQGQAAETSLCPECGSDFRRPGGERIGAVRWRRGLVWAGALLVSVGVTGEVLCMRGTFDQINWWPYKPFSWLLADAKPISKPDASTAMAELFRRNKAGLLSDSQIHRLITFALDLQGDPAAGWNGAWGDFIEAEREKGTVSDEEITRYARQAVPSDFNWAVKKRVELGQRIPWRLTTKGGRSGFNSQLSFTSRFNLIEIDGETDTGQFGGSHTFGLGSAEMRSKVAIDPEKLRPGGPRKLTARATLAIRVFEGIHDFDDHSISAIYETQFNFKSDFELVPENSINIELVSDPLQLPELNIVAMKPFSSSSIWRLEFTRKSNSPLTPVAADVLIRSGDKLTELNSVFLPGKSDGFRDNDCAFLIADTHPPDGRYKVILRPNRKAALESMNDTDEIWGEPIELEVGGGKRDANEAPADTLLTIVDSSKDAELTLAFDELKRRQMLGRLSHVELQSLVAVALRKQADRSIEWNPDWGDMIEQERARGNVSDADWATYARQAVEDTLEWAVQKRVEIGKRAEWTLSRRPARSARLSRLFEILTRGRTEILGMPPPENDGISSTSGGLGRNTSGMASVLPFSAEELAQGGPRTLTAQMTVDLGVYELPRPSPSPGSSVQEMKLVYKLKSTLSSDFEMIEPGQDPIRLVTDPTRRPIFEFRLDPEHTDRLPYQIILEYKAVSIRVAIAAEVSIRVKGSVLSIGRMTVRPEHGEDVGRYLFHLPEGITIQGGSVDLILNPSVEVAKLSADLDEIWGETIEVKNLKISEATPQE